MATVAVAFGFSFATRRDPLNRIHWALASADFRFTDSWPARLAHQFASSLSFLNFGIFRAWWFTAIIVPRYPFGRNRVCGEKSGRWAGAQPRVAAPLGRSARCWTGIRLWRGRQTD